MIKINPNHFSGLIRVLHKQLGSKTNVNIQTLRKKWRGLSLELDDLDKAIKEGGFKVNMICLILFVVALHNPYSMC